jgi:hypothetical protein
LRAKQRNQASFGMPGDGSARKHGNRRDHGSFALPIFDCRLMIAD